MSARAEAHSEGRSGLGVLSLLIGLLIGALVVASIIPYGGNGNFWERIGFNSAGSQQQPSTIGPRTNEDEGKPTQAPDSRYTDIECPDGIHQIEWSSAGPAPQTKNDAANLLDTDPRDLTILTYPCPGNEVAIGWVVGTSNTEKDGKIQNIGFVPAGTCVDYDEGPSQVYADLAHHQKFDAVNDRSLVASDGSAEGLKFTVYWTPCVFTDGYADGGYDAPVDEATPSPDGNDGGGNTVFECPLGDPDAFIDAVVVNLDPDKDGIDADIDHGKIGGNGYLLTSGDKFRVTRPNSHWVLHTNNYPQNPGLPVNAKETVTKVSAYCE